MIRLLVPALAGGLLWYVFAREQSGTRKGSAKRGRTRTRSARRTRARGARPAAA